MSLIDELEHLAQRIGDDAEQMIREGAKKLQEHVLEHPQFVFELLRSTKPVLVTHGFAIVTRYDDVVEILESDGPFSVTPYAEKMRALAGDFILGLDDSAQYERDVSILRLAAPRSDMPGLADFVSEQADSLVAAGDGQIDVVDLTSRVPARLIDRWFGTPGPDEDTQIAWTRAMFADIFLNLQGDAQLTQAATRAAAAMRPHLDEVIAARKRSGNGDDVLGRLIAMQANPQTAFTDAEIRTSFIGLIVGFIPTVMTATTLALDALLDRPEALTAAQEAARADDDDAVRSHMWEAMRLAPQAPGLIRRAATDFVVAADTVRATRIPAGTTTFAATQSAMLDGDVIDDPKDFRAGRPPQHYLHFGAGLHECFGRFANAMQIPLIAKAILRQPGLERAPGDDGQLARNPQFPTRLMVRYRPNGS